jgi:cell wall-associated NlpC family hydrolase
MKKHKLFYKLILLITIALFAFVSCKSGKSKPKKSGSGHHTFGSSNSQTRQSHTFGKSSKINKPKKPSTSKSTSSSKGSTKSSSKTTESTAAKVDKTPVSAKAEKAVATAKSYRGVKYKYGGTDRKGIDCSSLTGHAYQSVGVTLPRVSREQAKVGKRIYMGDLQKGDLIFFGASPGSKTVTHVGIVSYHVGDVIKFVHASTSSGVVESVLSPTYWRPRYILARRPLAK